MIFPGWQIGLDIQAEGIRAVAVQWHRQGWQLRHWWFLPFPEPMFTDGILPEPDALCEALGTWRKTIPARYQLRVGFPAQRTLQRPVPLPDSRLQESAREKYIVGAAARQLQIPASQLCCDYQDGGDPLCVTAVRREDIDALLSGLKRIRLFPKAITPVDKALSALPAECYPVECRFLVHEEERYWLWASVKPVGRSGWLDRRQVADFAALCQQLNASAGEIALSCASDVGVAPMDAKTLNAWWPIIRHQPPLPVHGGLYTLALGLVLGRGR